MSNDALKEDARELKLASAASQLEDNESAHPKPVQLQSEMPEKKELDAEACFRELAKGQNDVLPKAFGEFNSSASKDKSFMNGLFANRSYESHSPLLRKHAQDAQCDGGRTLRDRTRKLLG